MEVLTHLPAAAEILCQEINVFWAGCKLEASIPAEGQEQEQDDPILSQINGISTFQPQSRLHSIKASRQSYSLLVLSWGTGRCFINFALSQTFYVRCFHPLLQNFSLHVWPLEKFSDNGLLEGAWHYSPFFFSKAQMCTHTGCTLTVSAPASLP